MNKTNLPFHYTGIGVKLSIFSLALIALITSVTAVIVVRIMDDSLLTEMIKRGRSIALSAATPAGFSILSGDRLALDNLSAKMTESQPDLVYLAIVDAEGKILAHNDMNRVGEDYVSGGGPFLNPGGTVEVRSVRLNGKEGYEFVSPVLFAGREVGKVYLGIDASSLEASRRQARTKIVWLSLAALGSGFVGALLLSRFLTRPIKRLSHGVAKIKQGDYHVALEPGGRDELGALTLSFNEMAEVIRGQKEHLVKYAENLEASYEATVRILAAAIDARDQYTYGHSSRVAGLSLLMGERLGLSSEALKDLEMACFLHDVGKIRIPDHILNKQGPLDDQEATVIREHPRHGAEILFLAESLHRYIPAVLQHHENYDGSGYPAGLKGDEIHLHAQIVALADSYDAMISSRPYRVGASRETAIEEILRFRGRQFSPVLTDLFMDILPQFDAEQYPSFMGGAR